MDPKLKLVTPDLAEEVRDLNDNERAAAEVVALLEQIAERIPRLQAPDPKTAARVRGARTVPRGYVISMIETVRPGATVRSLSGFDPEEARDALQFKDAFRPVAEQMAVLLKSVRFTMDARMADVVEKALIAYEVTRASAKATKNGEMLARLETAARYLNRDRSKKKPPKSR